MIEFKDLKRALESLPFGIENVQEDSRLIEDLGVEEDDILQLFSYLQFELDAEFPDDDAFFRFAAHMPMCELVEVCNMDIGDPLD